jgi:hypothetical protein
MSILVHILKREFNWVSLNNGHKLPKAKRVFDKSIMSIKHPCFMSKFCIFLIKCVVVKHVYKICKLCTLSHKFHPMFILQANFIFKHAYTHRDTQSLNSLQKVHHMDHSKTHTSPSPFTLHEPI